MLYVFMGESCTGKSTVADEIKKQMLVDIYSGKDYLRFAKNKQQAWNLFSEELQSAVEDKKHIIYVIAEVEDLGNITALRCKKVKFSAELDIIKTRFSKRMNGHLPKPVEQMIERKGLLWKEIVGDINIDTSAENELMSHVDKILKS